MKFRLESGSFFQSVPEFVTSVVTWNCNQFPVPSSPLRPLHLLPPLDLTCSNLSHSKYFEIAQLRIGLAGRIMLRVLSWRKLAELKCILALHSEVFGWQKSLCTNACKISRGRPDP